MKRVDKKDLARIIKDGSLDDKLRIIVDDKVNRSIYGKGIVTKKEIQELVNSVADEDDELMHLKIDAINKVIKRRQDFALYASKLDYLAEFVNGGLEKVDMYVGEAYLLNALLDDIKSLKEENSKLYERIYKRITLRRSINESIKFVYDKGSNSYKVDASKLEKQLRIALDNFKYYLKQAKILTLVLERFAKENGIENLIPYDIKDRVEGFQLDYSRCKRFSAKNYRKLLADKSIESVLQIALMEDNGDIEFIFPYYEDIEVKDEELKDLIIFK